MPLFSKRHPSEVEKPSGSSSRWWYTNAPAHWPAVERKNLPANQSEVMHQLAFATFAQKALQESGSGCRFAAARTTRLDPSGLLQVTIEVEDRGERVPVFFYRNADLAAGAHYAGAIKFLEARGEPRPVYYAPARLPDAPPGSPLRAFEWHDLRPGKEPPPKEPFAMWWTSPGGEVAVRSGTVDAIGRAYRALDGIGSYVFAALMTWLKQAEPDTRRLPLPAEEETLLLQGPEKRPLLLTVSQEKGFQFRFSVRDTPPAYRDAFWSVFAAFAEHWKKALTDANLPRDPPGPLTPLRYWTAMETSLAGATQAGNPPEQIGPWIPT